MHAAAADASVSIRDRFLADHHRLERLLERLLFAFEANAREDVVRLWTEFESDLSPHMQEEESSLLPALQRVSPTNARILAQEHRHIRSRLVELGLAVDLHAVRLETGRAFIDELRAHASTEDRLLYQWADERLERGARQTILASFATRLRARAAGRAVAAAR